MRMSKRIHVLCLALAAGSITSLWGCASSSQPQEPVVSAPQLFSGLGAHHRTVTTSSAEAQHYFDQGLIWSFSFNHDEAIRSFQQAAALDPDCAMAWWGVALCNGPHINNPVMPEERSKAAWDALTKAQQASAKASPTERELIDALAKRYASPAPADRAELDKAYADAMRTVWSRHRNDDDIGALFAESMMDLRPWDLWMKDGTPQPGTTEIIDALEAVLRMSPDHPGANHLYIHAVEASPFPERADVAADRLRKLVPASGHMVHMPGHIDIRRGRWQLASEANVNAITVDAAYRKLSPTQGFYRVYMAHNHQFLAFTSMMEGRRSAALEAAHQMVAGVPEDFIASAAPLVDPAMSIVYDVEKRFGMWDDILREPMPDARLPITTAMWRFSRAIALAAKNQLSEAESEREKFKDAVTKVPKDAMMTVNPAHTILDIADHMLNGEIAYRYNRIDESVAELTRAVELEDTLRYMEPPDWIQPVRHTLGAVLVSAKRYSEAEAVYLADLKVWPENGWSLLGLKQCLEARGAAQEAKAVDARLARTWSRSQVKAQTTCLCVDKN